MSIEWVRCKRCGYDENPASANACMRCHGSLEKPRAEEKDALVQVHNELAEQTRLLETMSRWVTFIGVIVLLGVIGSCVWVLFGPSLLRYF